MAALSYVVTPAHAQTPNDDAVVLPFSCQMDKGRVTLIPTADKSHRVVGPRHSHAFTACRPGHPDQCRTWQIHRFDVACGPTVVPWLAVVAAALERWPKRGSVVQGRLVMTLGPQWRQPGSAQLPTLAFPRGYAPAIGFAARFQTPPNRPTVVDARPALDPKPRVALDPDAPLVERAAPAQSTDLVVSTWSTTIDAVAGEATTFGLNGWRAGGLAGAVLAAWGVLAVLRRRAHPASTSFLPPSGDAARNDEPSGGQDHDAAEIADLIARAVRLHRASRDALTAVPSDSLRALLADDLAAIQSVLLAPSLSGDVAGGRWKQAKSVVTVALGDLDRVARIIAGVLSSQPAGKGADSAPVNAAEAYDLLGINPDASRTVAKKIVDGLRQSWHPDLARSDEDRQRREVRIKQINVAWDLIRLELTADKEQTAA